MDASHLFTAALDLLGLLGFAGGGVIYFRKGRGDALLAYASNELSLNGVTITRLEKTLAALTAERDTLKRQNADLVNLAQGSPELIKLTQEIKVLAASIAAQGGQS